ncbi:hypothetical protein [Pelobacter seleniigenes]|uniref:hypothetical protein n=1 Tax=Pelobacter seleniigenes TaxID=407188 RepID=UPI0004A6F75F|nr:hypothetical protein [Pelobacter seleniigenes]
MLEAVDNVFSQLRQKGGKAFAEYRDFVCQEESEDIQHFFSLKNLPSILGSEHFIDMIKETFGDLHKDLELSNREVLSVDGQAVIQAVCAVCDIDKEQLFTFQRGVANVPKKNGNVRIQRA